MVAMPATLEAQVGGLQSEISPSQKNKTLTENNLRQKEAGGTAQVVEHLPSKCNALNSNSRTNKTSMG
jgi:hypothetical protein